MKTQTKIYFILLIFFISINNSSANQICNNYLSKTICNEGTLQQLNLVGKVELNFTKVIGNTNIAGKLIANNARLNQLNISGKVKLTNSIIQGNTKISGHLFAKNTKFLNPIIIATDNACFINSKINNIIIKKHISTTTIYLKHNTIIYGDITFQAKNGIIFQDVTSRILGKISGARVYTNLS